MEYTVNGLARLAGVSVRTLHWYDEIGLLRPARVTEAGYRMYGPAEVDALQSILLYRALDVPLKKIGALMADTSAGRLAALLTPNRPEAEMLAGMKVNTEADVAEAGRRMLAMGAKAVLIKGGHFDSAIVCTDWLCLPDEAPRALRQPHVDSNNNHGTGCTLSAAIATGLGKGLPLLTAVTHAQEFVNMTMRHSYTPGKGCGPLNHAAGLVRQG